MKLIYHKCGCTSQISNEENESLLKYYESQKCIECTFDESEEFRKEKKLPFLCGKTFKQQKYASVCRYRLLKDLNFERIPHASETDAVFWIEMYKKGKDKFLSDMRTATEILIEEKKTRAIDSFIKKANDHIAKIRAGQIKIDEADIFELNNELLLKNNELNIMNTTLNKKFEYMNALEVFENMETAFYEQKYKRPHKGFFKQEFVSKSLQ